MSTSTRLLSGTFTALPGLVFVLLLLQTAWHEDYWWGTYLAVLLTLVLSSLFLGFVLPPVLQRIRVRHPWFWISLSGWLAWVLSLNLLGLLNLTPLCVGQNNGDGNNDIGMCLFMTALSGIVYTLPYIGMLLVSALVGHLAIRGISRSPS
jgi:hypothetical protein